MDVPLQQEQVGAQQPKALDKDKIFSLVLDLTKSDKREHALLVLRYFVVCVCV
jgi:hypothetical protein